MKLSHLTARSPALAAVLAALALTVSSALARPYATCLTNNAGVISFRLNAPADNVKVLWNNGANSADLGALPKGLTVTANLGVTGPFKVQVTSTLGPGYPQGITNTISDDANTFVKFANGRGLAVNLRPGSPYFGRIYVSCGSAGTALGRATGDGIYVLNADQTDAVGQGDTALTGGLDFASSAENPHRLAVGEDDNLYISDWSDPTGTLYVTDPNVANNGTATNVLDGLGGPFPVTSARIHGSINGAVAEGSLAQGNLVVYTVDEDLQEDRETLTKTQLNSIWRWDIGAGPLPYNGTPTRLITPGTLGGFAQLCELRRGPDGKFYYTHRRANPASTAGAFVISADGSTQLWDSISAWRAHVGNPSAADALNETRGIDVSRDGKYMATFNNTNAIRLLPLVDGVPVIANLLDIPTAPTTAIGRALAFDAVGNLYTVSSGQGLLRIYSPGGFSRVTTGSDGTLDIYAPTMEVSVTASANALAEGGASTATLTFTRAGLVTEPLTVNFTATGTATRGADYVLRTNGVTVPGNSVIIPAGQSSVAVALVVTDDGEAEFAETAIITLAGSADYTSGSPSSQTITIADNEPATIDLSTVYDSMYERVPGDYVRFRMTRRGSLDDFLFLNIEYSGTATANADFTPNIAETYLFAGDVSRTFDVNPLDDALLEGPETLVATVVSGTGYVPGNASATATIVDDELPVEEVLFSDNFETDTTANWLVTFGSANGIDDKRVQFNYDYSADGIPAAPGAATTRGLKLTVNKDEATALGAAGVNVYPVGQNLTGNYAVRFQMFLEGVNGAGTTEHATFGINHSGTKANWFTRSTAAPGITGPLGGDGVWFNVVADSSDFPGGGTYGAFSAPNDTTLAAVLAERWSTDFEGVFKAPPYRFAGTPCSYVPGVRTTWVDVEVSHVGGVITWKINNQQILQIPNSTAYTSGKLMLGYNDAFNSIAPSGGFVVFDNVRVIKVTVPTVTITEVKVVGGNVEISFTGPAADAPSAYVLQASSTPSPAAAYADVSATITGSNGSYKAVRALSGPVQFYRVKRP